MRILYIMLVVGFFFHRTTDETLCIPDTYIHWQMMG